MKVMKPSLINDPNDEAVAHVLAALAPFQRAHPRACIDVRRSALSFLSIRIIDPAFEQQDRIAREDAVWPLLEQLPDETMQDLSVLLLLTPAEVPHSLANIEFERPIVWPDREPAADA